MITGKLHSCAGELPLEISSSQFPLRCEDVGYIMAFYPVCMAMADFFVKPYSSAYAENMDTIAL